MNDSGESSPAQQVLTMWVIWLGIFAGLFIIATFAAPKANPDAETVTFTMSPVVIGGTLAVVVGLLIRFVVIPKLNTLTAKLPAMIVGIALCEAAGIVGMFVIPTTHAAERSLLFSLAVAGVAVSAPIYARKAKDQSPFHQS